MTTVNIAQIAQSIASLNYGNGIHSVDIYNLPVDAGKLCPLFAPNPDNFLTEPLFERVTLGSNGVEAMNLEYNMHWVYYHAPIGANLGLFSVYGQMIENLAAILTKIFDNDATPEAIDIKLQDVPRIAIIKDPAGHDYHGIEIVLHILEYVN